jgi:hypothetical protein
VFHLENIRRVNFIKNMLDMDDTKRNDVVNFVLSKYVNRAEYVSLTAKFGLKISWTRNKIKAMSFLSFKNMQALDVS